MTLYACLPLPSLSVRYAHLTVLTSLSHEQGLLWLRHESLQSCLCNHWPYALEPTPSFDTIHFINWSAKCLFSFAPDCSLLSGSLTLEALLIGVLFKKCYVNV